MARIPPSQSTPSSAEAASWPVRRSRIQIATAPSGMLRANTIRHASGPSTESSAPPITGPSAVVTAAEAAQTPIAPPRSSRG